MYIRRKVFSTFIDTETGEERLFSTTEIMSEESYLEGLFSESESEQKDDSSKLRNKTYSSKAQKLLRSKHDIQIGLKKIKELKQAFKPELVGKETVENARRYGREINKTPSSTGVINPSSIHEKISRKGRIRSFQKEGIIDGYTADNMVKDTISPGLSGRVLVRSLN